MSVAHSVLKTRLTHQGPVRAEYLQIAEELEADSQFLAKRQPIVQSGAHVEGIYVLRSGWAVARFGTGARKSAITRLYLPGDIIGLTELFAGEHPYQVSMISDGSASKVSKGRVIRLSYGNPGLMGRLAYFDQLDSIASQERLFAMGRFSAEERIKHFLLTVHARLSTTMAITGEKFPFYMQMNELGDINGLSAVTISNVIGRMRANGEVTLAKSSVELHQRPKWVREIGFINRYAPRAARAA